MPLDLSKIDQSALVSKAGILTSEWAAFQAAHGAAKVVIGLGIVATIGSGVAAVFPAYPQYVALGGLIAGLATTVAGNMLSKSAAADYQDTRNLTKTSLAQAVASVVQAQAETAVAEATKAVVQAPIVATITAPEAAPMPTTPTLPVVPPGPAPGSIVPAVLQSLVLLVIMCLTGCLSDQARTDGTQNAQSIFNSAEALRTTLGLPQGIAGLDLTKPLSPMQSAQVYIYNIEIQAGALGGLLTTAPPNPVPAATPAPAAPTPTPSAP